MSVRWLARLFGDRADRAIEAVSRQQEAAADLAAAVAEHEEASARLAHAAMHATVAMNAARRGRRKRIV